MDRDRKKAEGRVATWDELQRSGGGGPPEEKRPLHRIFAQHIRTSARKIIFKAKVKSDDGAVASLNRAWEKVAKGGFEGTLYAGKIVLRNKLGLQPVA